MKAFVDTNVFVYTISDSDKAKARRAQELIARLSERRDLVISTQVLHELYSVLVRKQGFPAATALAVVEQLAQQAVHPGSTDLTLRALRLSASRNLSPWDALIIQAAIDAGCDTLYTEDLNHGQRIARLSILNPFADQPPEVHEPTKARYGAAKRRSARKRRPS